MADALLTISGNLAGDPELRSTNSGLPVVSFKIMQNKREKDQAGNWNETAKNGLRVTAWRELAEHIAESFQKGQRVIVTGRLEPQQWQDKNTGENRYDWQLIADDAGHSLRFATAQAVKAERSSQQSGGGFGGGPQQSNDNAWGAPQGGYNKQQGGYNQQQTQQQPPANDPWGSSAAPF